MTTILIHATAMKVYTDSRATISPNRSWVQTYLNAHLGEDVSTIDDNFTKMWRLDNNSIVVGCGDADVVKGAYNEMNEKQTTILSKPFTKDNTTVYVVKKSIDDKGIIRVIEFKNAYKKVFKFFNKRYLSMKIHHLKENQWITAGSGGDYLAGALQSGSMIDIGFKSVYHFDKFSGGEIKSLDIL